MKDVVTVHVTPMRSVILAFQEQIAFNLGLSVPQVQVISIRKAGGSSLRLLSDSWDEFDPEVEDPFMEFDPPLVHGRQLTAPSISLGPDVPAPTGAIGYYQLSFRLISPYLASGFITSRGLGVSDVHGDVSPDTLFSLSPYLKFDQVPLQSRVGRECCRCFIDSCNCHYGGPCRLWQQPV